jgi:hypothetical protein
MTTDCLTAYCCPNPTTFPQLRLEYSVHSTGPDRQPKTTSLSRKVHRVRLTTITSYYSGTKGSSPRLSIGRWSDKVGTMRTTPGFSRFEASCAGGDIDDDDPEPISFDVNLVTDDMDDTDNEAEPQEPA